MRTPEEMSEFWIQTITPALKEAFKAGWRARGIALAEERAGEPTPTLLPTPEQTFSPTPHEPERYAEPISPELVPPDWRPVFHLRGNSPCRRPALFITRLLEETERISTSVIRRLSGQTIKPDEAAYCGSCRMELVSPFSSNDLEWEPHIIHRPKTVIFKEPESDVLTDIEASLHEPYGPELPDIPGMIPDEQAELRQIAREVGYRDNTHS